MDAPISLLDALEVQLGPETIQTLSTHVGIEPAAAAHAVSMAIPILIGRLSANSANAEGAAALDAALAAHTGGGSGEKGGDAILQHLLGARRTSVEEGLSRASGITTKQAGQILASVAPVVMGVLGSMRQAQGVDAVQLPVVLGQANLDMSRQSTAIGDLSRVLDSTDETIIADEVARLGASMLGGMLGQGAGAGQ